MTNAQIIKRLRALEAEVEQLKRERPQNPAARGIGGSRKLRQSRADRPPQRNFAEVAPTDAVDQQAVRGQRNRCPGIDAAFEPE